MQCNSANLLCLDMYFSSKSSKKVENISDDNGFSKYNRMPLLSWDVFMLKYQKALKESTKRMEMNIILSFAEKHRWKNDLKTAVSENNYKALIITDKNQKIIWVNDGFSSMTGYSKNFALNKSPKFLRGAKTSQASISRFREKILKDKPFKEIITNYKKDNTIYKCEVKIIPLYNENTTHYLAFEREVV